MIPSLRGKLRFRTTGYVLVEAQKLAHASVKELLVISQDNSTHGINIKYKNVFYQGRPVKLRIKEPYQALSELDIWVRLHLSVSQY